MSLYDAIKDAVSAAKDVKDAAIKSAIAKVEIEAAQATLELASCKTELAQAREDLRAAQGQLDLRASLKFDRNLYWRELRAGAHDGPFCTACADDKGKAIRLHHHPRTTDRSYYMCPACKYVTDDPDASPPRQRAPLPRRDLGIV